MTGSDARVPEDLAALSLVRQIKENTQGVWALEATNETAAGILEGWQVVQGLRPVQRGHKPLVRW